MNLNTKEQVNLQNKHVLVVTSVYPLTADGNHGAFVREAILHLQATGLKFLVFAPAYEGSKSYMLDGIQVHRFRYFFRPFENLVRDGAPTKIQRQPLYLIVAFFYILLGTWQLFQVCRIQKPDLLKIHWPFPHALMALPASKLLGIPMIFSFHGGELLLARKFRFVAKILYWLLPQASGVVTNSTFTKTLVQKLYVGDVTVIPYGVTVEPKPPITRPPEEEPRLLFVGRLDERKGLEYLLEALPLILSKQSVRLRIVGEGILSAQLKTKCQNLGLEKVVDFLGFLSKEALAQEYASCDVFILPAIVDSKGDTEGLGVVIIEAIAHQKPVIATNVGGIPDVISHEKTGILVTQKDPKALAEAVLTLLFNPEQAAVMAQRGLEDIKERFSWFRIVKLWQAEIALVLLSKTTKKFSSFDYSDNLMANE